MISEPAPGDHRVPPHGADFAIQFHLLGSVSLDDCVALQRWLVYEIGGTDDGRMIVLLCEHPWSISMGRRGSRAHVRMTPEQLRARQWDVRWLSRGGGCLLHGPGQLAIYPIVSLAWHGWTVGEYLNRLRAAMIAMLGDLRIAAECRTSDDGVWGRTGQLVACGVAVRHDITSHGLFVNVGPNMLHFPFVDVVDPRQTRPGQKSTMGSLAAEGRRALSMSQVRAAVIPRLADSLGTHRYHLITGHPWLVRHRERQSEPRHRAC